MENLNLAGFKVIKTQIDLDLVETVYNQIQSEFDNMDPQNLRSGLDQTNGVGYQWAKTLPEINQQLYPAIKQAYDIDQTDIEIIDSWILLQTDERWINNPVHDHRGGGSLVIVVYIMADPQTDSISFFDDAGNESKLYVQAGDVLLFPSVAKHKPNPSTNSNFNRISYNIALNKIEQETEESKSRMDVCNACDRLMQPVKICKECYCFMPAKTLIPISVCPLGKW
jgi:hypothetical protein